MQRVHLQRADSTHQWAACRRIWWTGRPTLTTETANITCPSCLAIVLDEVEERLAALEVERALVKPREGT